MRCHESISCCMLRSIAPMSLLAMIASGCGGIVVVDGRGASSDNASSTGAGGASSGTGSPSGGSAAGGTGGSSAPADRSAPTPTVLAENQIRPVDIAVDASNVYWVSYGGSDSLEIAHVFALPKSGGTPALVVKGGDSVYAFEIAIDEDSLYWRTNGESLLMSTPKMGGASKLLSGQTGIGAFVPDATQMLVAPVEL